MNTYVVAWYDHFSNDLSQHILNADNPAKAVIKYVRYFLDNAEWSNSLLDLYDNDDDEWFDAIDEQVFNADQAVSVIKI